MQLPISNMLPFEDYETLVGMERYTDEVRSAAPTPSPFSVHPLDEASVRVILGYQEEEEFGEKDDNLDEYDIELAI